MERAAWSHRDDASWQQALPVPLKTPLDLESWIQPDKSPMVVGPRIGFWSGLATGTAWFDDLRLVPRIATAPHPHWKILLLVYAQTDVVITAANGTKRHVVGTSTQAELDKTAEQARLFVQQDVPTLTSGHMLPTLTVRHARASRTSPPARRFGLGLRLG